MLVGMWYSKQMQGFTQDSSVRDLQLAELPTAVPEVVTHCHNCLLGDGISHCMILTQIHLVLIRCLLFQINITDF